MTRLRHRRFEPTAARACATALAIGGACAGCTSPMPAWRSVAGDSASVATPASPLTAPPGATAPAQAAPGDPRSGAATAAVNPSAQLASTAVTARASATPSPVPTPPLPPAAVAARFPDPSTAFDTPAFASGRGDFTRNDELRALLTDLATRRPAGLDIRLLELGASQAGEPIVALAFASSSLRSATTKRPAVLLVGGERGDEPAAAEALVVFARQVAAGRFERALQQVDVVVLPRANPDAAGLFQRNAADGTDLGRDHLLVRTPEAQAIAQLMAGLQPLVVAELREYPAVGAFAQKFAALPRADALVQASSGANLAPFVAKADEEWFRAPLAASLGAAGYATDWWHATSDDAADRRVAMGGTATDGLRNVAGAMNAVGLVVASRGQGLGKQNLGRRVAVLAAAAASIVDSAGARSADLQKIRQFVDRDVAAKACQGDAILEAAPTPSEYALAVVDPVSGAQRRLTVNWESTLQTRAVKSRPRPCGYAIAASEVDAVQRLRLLGVEVAQFDEPAELRAEAYREIAREAPPPQRPDEMPRLRVATTPALTQIPSGSYWVSLEQPSASLAIAALEPEAPGSYAAARVVASAASVTRILARPPSRLSTLP